MAKVDEETAAVEQDSMAGCGVCCPLDPDVLGLKRYNYRWLCLPSLPCLGGAKPPLFLAKDERLPLLLSLVMGLQHALAMVAGIATAGGKLIAGDACFAWQRDQEMCDRQAYLISAAWITSGLLTFIQVFRAKLCGGYYLGTGLVSVMGTSFSFLPVAREMVVGAIKDAKARGEDPTGAGVEGYGRFLGTCMVASLLEMGLAMLPSRVRRKLFPPVVTGTAVFLIGASLVSAGIKNLGGGVFCAENDLSRAASFGGPQLCEGNGDVVLPFGSPQYVLLGLSVIFMVTLLQIVGSPFLKSTALFWGLLFGMLVAGVSSYTAVEGDTAWEDQGDGAYELVAATPGRSYGFFNSAVIDKAPTVTFLWAETFPIGFAPEYLLPILIAYFVSTAETIGDVAASCDASEIPSSGPDTDSRVQGGLFADGLSSLLACLFTSPPNTTYSENNGVLKLTRCASRSAGFACALWLVLFGVFGKVGALFASVPDCVVGGLTLMCFAMVMVSGIEILAKGGMDRRTCFITMLSLGFGLGVAMLPNLFEGGGSAAFYGNNLRHNIGFWPKRDVCSRFPTDESGAEVRTCIGNNGLCCLEYESSFLRTSVLMILKTPFCLGVIVAATLNFILPTDISDEEWRPNSSRQVSAETKERSEPELM